MRLIILCILVAPALVLTSFCAAVNGVAVIPQPSVLTPAEGVFAFKPDTAILTDPASRLSAQMLSRALGAATGYDLNISPGKAAKNNAILLVIDPGLGRLGEEGYLLEVTPRRIVIRAPKPAGVFYGTQSLGQLLPPAAYSPSVRRGVIWQVPCLKIEDSPRFSWRGAQVDVARHFMPKAGLYRFIDSMAMLKLNVLQFHFTDDQGWRIEIRKYPRLTEVGGVRRETRLGHEREKKGFDGTPHRGYYSQDDLRDIVAYAGERFITIIPEIEMPGHAQAAIAAYPELGNTTGQIEVSGVWGIHNHVFNVEEKTILFLQDVLAEVLELFPSKFIHVGGDEVRKDEWKASPAAQARMKELGLKNENELQSYFIRRMDQFLTSKGRRLVGWDEILEGGLAPGATVMSWRGIKGGIEAARAGHDVVMTPTDFTYLDYYQSKDPGEPLAIGGFLPLEKVYSFEPVPGEFTPAEAKRVLGTQGQIWTEYIPTMHHLEYMAFPRLAALAEVAWTPAAQRDYVQFTGRLRVAEQRWRILGVNFR